MKLILLLELFLERYFTHLIHTHLKTLRYVELVEEQGCYKITYKITNFPQAILILKAVGGKQGTSA